MILNILLIIIVILLIFRIFYNKESYQNPFTSNSITPSYINPKIYPSLYFVQTNGYSNSDYIYTEDVKKLLNNYGNDNNFTL
jgi:hypothetical protein